MAYIGGIKTKPTKSGTWPKCSEGPGYNNRGDYRYMLLIKLDLHLRDLNNQINELTFENIRLRNK